MNVICISFKGVAVTNIHLFDIKPTFNSQPSLGTLLIVSALAPRAKQVNDAEATQLSIDLSRKIQDEMVYPGQVKITVIRETRAVSFAK